MKNKNITIFLSLLFIGVQLLLAGCNQKYDEVWYQSPSWTPEGLIYFQKSITHYDKQPMGTITLGTDYEFWTMTDDGTQETKLPYNKYPYYSPQGTYAAFISGNNISIVRRSDNQEIHNFSPTTESVSEMDWGPNEDKLVYITNHHNLFVIDVDGANNAKIANNAATVAWRVGQKIVYGFLYIVNQDGTDNAYLADGGKPQIMNSGKVLFSADFISPGNYKIKSIYPTGTGESVVLNSYDKDTLKLSPDNSKITGGEFLESGIWVVDVDGSGLQKLK